MPGHLASYYLLYILNVVYEKEGGLKGTDVRPEKNERKEFIRHEKFKTGGRLLCWGFSAEWKEKIQEPYQNIKEDLYGPDRDHDAALFSCPDPCIL